MKKDYIKKYLNKIVTYKNLATVSRNLAVDILKQLAVEYPKVSVRRFSEDDIPAIRKTIEEAFKSLADVYFSDNDCEVGERRTIELTKEAYMTNMYHKHSYIYAGDGFRVHFARVITFGRSCSGKSSKVFSDIIAINNISVSRF